MKRFENLAKLALLAAATLVNPSSAAAQIKAQARARRRRPGPRASCRSIRESYYNAIECGKQGGQDPPCVFYDTGLCKNGDFALALYTPYKMVAYEVWRVVRLKQPAPTPNYPEAQRTRVTVGITPVRGAKNAFKRSDPQARGQGRRGGWRGARVEGGMRITYDYPAWAADRRRHARHGREDSRDLLRDTGKDVLSNMR